MARVARVARVPAMVLVRVALVARVQVQVARVLVRVLVRVAWVQAVLARQLARALELLPAQRLARVLGLPLAQRLAHPLAHLPALNVDRSSTSRSKIKRLRSKLENCIKIA